MKSAALYCRLNSPAGLLVTGKPAWSANGVFVFYDAA